MRSAYGTYVVTDLTGSSGGSYHHPMPIGISDEHQALHDAVTGWVERHCPPSVPRSLLDAEREELPSFWADLAAQGWTGIHLEESFGGEGYGIPELVVVLEALGRAVAPGPFLATTLAGAVLQVAGKEVAAALAPGLADGSTVGTVALSGSLDAEPDDDGALVVRGTLRAVLSAHLADLVIADAGGTWVVLPADEVKITELPSIDRTRRTAEVTVDRAVVPPGAQLATMTTDGVRDLAAILFAADAVGASQWCVDTASDYAKDRRQFGRPIGQFQGVKHRCANMLARTELARAAAWDAARAAGDAETEAFAAAAAASLAIEGFFETAKDCVQTLGGIGFTWEHDAHLYLRRAIATRALLGSAASWRVRSARLALGGAKRRLHVDLPDEAEAHREELRELLAGVKDLDPLTQRVRIADEGLVAPQWPQPWGRDADALEQVVIDEEFKAAGMRRPNIAVGAWALPPLMVYGTEAQQQRWIPPTLRGEITWCQLFSEPGAGSDLASLSTRAERVEGGWMVNGQKVWTSMADRADWGILLARTDPEAPKHDGISFFMLDMKTPGVDVRPLRELTGDAMFNEVFLDDVFVPEDCIVGREHDGWRATRTSLANERVSMGSGATLGFGIRGILDIVRTSGREEDTAVLAEVGELVARGYALAVLGFRLTLSALTGADPSGSEASVKKLLGVENDQKVQEVGLGLLDGEGAITDGPAATWSQQFLFTRCLTIAGGTSEIQRNIIAERVLGLPKDP
jgi:alkylation response protein AidB-like acyl-CoA dehydrogenase